ncbi:MAG: phosphotransferase [Dehalococcoidales bacterium]
MIPASSNEITADWLNGALHESGFLPPGRKLVSLTHEPVGIGEGFVSDMARLTVEYDGDGNGLPATMIAKMPTPYESANAVAMLFNIYEREIRFYLEVAERSPIRTPKPIYGAVDAAAERYLLLIEDCSRFAQVDQIEGLNRQQTEQAVVALADFHAHWWDSEELDRMDWLPKPRGPLVTPLADTYRGCWEVSLLSEEFVAALPPGGREAGQLLHEHFPRLIDEAPGDKLTISHFDFRVDNLFFDFENAEQPVVVFDWQAANANRGVTDVAYLLGGSLPIELRRKIEKDVVKLYHRRLLERGVTGYSFDECWDDYRRGTLVYAYIPALGCASLDPSSERAKRLMPTLTERHFAAIVDNDATSLLA